MKIKTTVILFGVFIILLVFVYLFEGPLSEKRQRDTAQPSLLFPDFEKTHAAQIQVKSPARTISLNKDNEGWSIADTDGFRADPQLVNAALDTIARFVRESIVSTNPEKQEIFEVTPAKGVEVKVFDLDQKILVHFYIGKTAADFFSTYLRKEGSDEVLQVGSVTATFDRDSKGWRDKTILAFAPDAVTKLVLTTPAEEIALEKNEEGTWAITQPVSAPAQQEVLTTILRTLSSLKALDFAKDYDVSAYQLDTPQITVTLILKDQEEKRLLIGKMDEEKSQYYAKNQAKKTIFLIGKYHFDTVNKSLEDLKAAEKKDEPADGGSQTDPGMPPADSQAPEKTDQAVEPLPQDDQP